MGINVLPYPISQGPFEPSSNGADLPDSPDVKKNKRTVLSFFISFFIFPSKIRGILYRYQIMLNKTMFITTTPTSHKSSMRNCARNSSSHFCQNYIGRSVNVFYLKWRPITSQTYNTLFVCQSVKWYHASCMFSTHGAEPSLKLIRVSIKWIQLSEGVRGVSGVQIFGLALSGAYGMAFL